jgi:hypothetical protein
MTLSRVRGGHSVALTRPEDLPPEAGGDARTVTAMGTRSLAVVPFPIDDAVTGFLSVAARGEERITPDDSVARLTLLVDVFASALARRRVERAVEETRQPRGAGARARVTMLGELAAASPRAEPAAGDISAPRGGTPRDPAGSWPRDRPIALADRRDGRGRRIIRGIARSSRSRPAATSRSAWPR